MSKVIEFLLGSILIAISTVALVFFSLLHYILRSGGVADPRRDDVVVGAGGGDFERDFSRLAASGEDGVDADDVAQRIDRQLLGDGDRCGIFVGDEPDRRGAGAGEIQITRH